MTRLTTRALDLFGEALCAIYLAAAETAARIDTHFANRHNTENDET